MRKVPFQKRKSSNKFHFKVRRPHFKLQKALFKRGLERTCKNKNVLEFDVENMEGLFFSTKFFKKDYPFQKYGHEQTEKGKETTAVFRGKP